MAASGINRGVKPLQNAMKMAKLATQLDGGNRHKEAYCEYLRSINYITHALLEDAMSKQEKEMVVVEVERMLRLAEQCLERAKSFIGRRDEPPDLSTTTSPSLLSSSVQSRTLNNFSPVHPSSTVDIVAPSDTPVDKELKSPSSSKPGDSSILSEGSGDSCPFLPPDVFQRLQTVESQDISRKELTPIEEASRMNQKLKANYEARLARLPPGQAYQKTSLTLSLQRQMMENLIVAKARQQALHRKMEERRLRLQEEANRRFAASGTVTPEEQEQRILYTNVLEYEQDNDWPKLWKANLKKNPYDGTLISGLVSYLLSRSDHPVMKLLRKQQYRVYNRLYPIVSKALPPSPALSLKQSRSAHNLIHHDSPKNLTRTVGGGVGGQSLSFDSLPSPSLCSDLTTNYGDEEGEEIGIPVTVDRENSFEDLEQFLTQLDWAPSHITGNDTGSDSDLTFEPSMQLEHESHILELEMRALKEHLKGIVKDIHIAIDQLLSLCLLSFECLNTASSKDLCVASIEEVFFTPLWSPLLALFRKVHRERELAFECSVKLYRDASPGDIGVPLKLFPQDPSTLKGSYPYESAVQELKLLFKDCCPQRKLECIVRTLRLICACAEDYRCIQEGDSQPRMAAIGADDLLPILAYVALRCECPQLVSECAALEEFIHEGYLIGEEGYCLTSIQSALAYVESLHTGGAHSCTAKLA